MGDAADDVFDAMWRGQLEHDEDSPMTTASPEEIVERLHACADDPMWADHAEIPKSWCREAADLIAALTARYKSLGGQLNKASDDLDYYIARAETAEAALATLRAERDAWIEVHEEHAGQRESLLAERDHLLRQASAALATLREALREARDEIVDWGKRHPIVTPHFVKPLVTRIDALLAPSGNGEGGTGAVKMQGGIRYARAKGQTFDQMRANLPEDLYRIGDTILVWVNEGDFCLSRPYPQEINGAALSPAREGE